MSIAQAFLSEWEHEAVGTRKTLSRLPDDQFGFKPHDKSFSLGDLANHVATIPLWGQTTATTDTFDFQPPGAEIWKPPTSDSAAGLVALWDTAASGFIDALATVTDEQMMRPWSLLHSGQTLFTMPKVVCLRSFIFNHLVHHRAQLTVYLRMLDVPVPALYGPSADEQG